MAALYFGNGNNMEGVETAEKGIPIAREANALSTLVQLLATGGLSAGLLGDIEKAHAFAVEAIEIARRENYLNELSLALSLMGMLAYFANAPDVHVYPDEIASLAHKINDPRLIAMASQNTARLATARGDWAKARIDYEEAITQFLHMKDKRSYQSNRSDLAHMLRQSGQLDEAYAIYRTTLPAWQELGNRGAIAHELECLGFVALKRHQLQRAVTLWGVAEHLREECRSPMAPHEETEYDQAVSEVRQQLTESNFATAWQAGRALTIEQAVAFALE
jgi:tetratricopeptide (TPR) repeat protein